MMAKKRILSGMRPTGRLHLGHFAGALENWVGLQKEYENFHMVANWHALTTSYEATSSIPENILDMTIDWLCAGIDPEKSLIFVQSDVPEHAELHLLFSMLVTSARLERNPTLKEVIRDLHLGENVSYGLLGYPVLQAADILIYKADAVPVGEDQAPHIELTREIARRFNNLYGETFPEPVALLTPFSRLPGTDGNRMSKSVGNTILLADEPELISKKVMSTITDPQKIHVSDPGRPEICTVYTYHQKFNQGETGQIARECRGGSLGCVADKKNLARKLTDFLEPLREKRRYFETHMSQVEEILQEGGRKARAIAQQTMAQVRDAMSIR
jgi:tryptophanyl-tRNA synthetase